MIRLKVFSISALLLLLAFTSNGQNIVTGSILDAEEGVVLKDAELYLSELNLIQRSDADGKYIFRVPEKGTYSMIIFKMGYNTERIQVDLISDSLELNINMTPLSQELSEVVISQKRDEIFNLSRLNPVEGTALYAGKKSEVVRLEQMTVNFAANNARQIYSQVVGLNIYENNDGGLQLNVGGRGLDPNRTANFNTRQNGYDISADVLGYPESYYTPPAEALQEIQVVRGAASLQYGTQFGGLLNFRFKQPIENRKLELVSRQSLGSFGLFTSFNSLGGKIGKFSYYTYFNYKRSDGFRPNSNFDSKNFYSSLNYELGKNTDLTFETTYLNYLAKQPGGLTDTQFNQDPEFSNRERNWFEVDWLLMALKLKHKLSYRTDISVNLFALEANRSALGFRGDPKRPERNPITEPDDPDEFERDLLVGEFRNWGAETRLLTRYFVNDRQAVFLIGGKYYQSDNSSRQGPGSKGFDADFTFRNDEFPSYPNQSDFEFPNLNLALFGENIFFLSEKISITPGFRVEYIKTESEGSYTEVRYDNAGNEIFRNDTTDNRLLDRSLLLLGVGGSYFHSTDMEVYANISQNYRSVTFSDIRVVNPTFIIDPNIADERGFTTDVGIRGKWSTLLSYDLGLFALKYNDRIGTILAASGPNKGDRVRKNIGDALIYGFESFVDLNLIRAFSWDNLRWKLNVFSNLAITRSEYLKSEENNVEGKEVEFIPAINLKTGLGFGYKNLLGNIQFTYLSSQYTDAENTPVPPPGDSREGIIGDIPSYHILDVSLSYRYKMFKLEAGVNNLTNNSYFTRRATGYPGPGIIPSDPRSFYTTLEFTF